MYYKLKIDIVGNDYLTKTVYSVETYRTIEAARAAAQIHRDMLADHRSDYKIKDYRVDVIPSNEDNCKP